MNKQADIDPRSGNFIWSDNEEDFRNDDFGEILDRLESDGELKVGRTIYYGRRVDKPADYFMPDADFILDQAGDSAYDFGGEWAEDFGRDVSKEAKQELGTFLADWARRNLRVSFYQLEDVKPYTLTADDVDSAKTVTPTPAL